MSRIRKVSLIEPQPAGFHVYSSVALPRLGLPLLGAMMRNRGIDVSIHCQSFQPVDMADVLRSDLVGISTTTSTAPEGYRLAKRVREAGIPVVMGGSHVSFMADEALQHADYCIRGEGEYATMELLDALESGSGFDAIRGLSYNTSDGPHHNSARELVSDLNSLPFPDLSLIRGSEKMRISPVATSRGCPFDCSFCSVTKMFGRGCRERSIDNVIEEMSAMRPRSVFFYDDNFTANTRRTKLLLDAMLSKGITPPWSAQSRVDVVRDRELLEMMKRTNCYILYIGLESMNQETLNEFNKKQTVEEIVEAVRILHEYGIMTHGMFVFGAEHDQVSDLRATVDFALRNSIDTVQFMVLTPLPGTPTYTQMESEGRLLTKEWNLYDGLHVVYQPARMTPYELQKETLKAMNRFYSLVESAKMVFGWRFVRYATKLNLHLLMGRWRAARRMFDIGAARARYRTGAAVLLRRFNSANRDFGERVKALAERARQLKAEGASLAQEIGIHARKDTDTSGDIPQAVRE